MSGSSIFFYEDVGQRESDVNVSTVLSFILLSSWLGAPHLLVRRLFLNFSFSSQLNFDGSFLASLGDSCSSPINLSFRRSSSAIGDITKSASTTRDLASLART